MTREELIKHIKYTREINSYFVFTDEDVDMILEALSAEPCEDAISREAVLNTLELADKALDENRTVEAYKDLLKECIEQLLPVKVEPQEWISVKDSRKPKIRERVWVTDCDGDVWIMYYNDCDCYFNEFGDVFADDIIAWQPITEPSPYKGDE